MYFMTVKKSRKLSGFVIYSHFKNSAFIAVERAKKTRYVKGVPFVIERYAKGVPFLSKMVYKGVRGWTSGKSLAVTSTLISIRQTDVDRLMILTQSKG